MASKNIKAIKIEVLSSRRSERYVIVDTETGEILDDAQGFGYKSAPKAYAAFNYKNKSDKEKIEQMKYYSKVFKWMISHKRVLNYFRNIEFYDAKYPGEYGPVSIKDAEEIMKEYDSSEVGFFKPKDLKYVWNHQKMISKWIKNHKK